MKPLIQAFGQLLKRPQNQKIVTRSYQYSVFGTTSKIPINRFRALPDAAKNSFLTYIWIDGTGENLRSKMKVVNEAPTTVDEIDSWNFDGSSTYQASGHDSDLSLKPVAMCPNPFHPGLSKLVLCDVYDGKGKPVTQNHRARCADACRKCADKEPWFGFEQEHTFAGPERRPLGFPPQGYPRPQGPYYCSVGAGRNAGRDIAEAHLYACMYAGLNVQSTNAEVLLGQWAYQTGPSVGVRAGDQIWFSRYILYRIAEEFGVAVSLDPKPVFGDWNGSSCKVNFSTNETRNEFGISRIHEAIEKLKEKHYEHMEAYDPKGGEDNKRRLKYDFDEFTVGTANRNGWLEDRRPAANCDPYEVIERILNTCYIE